MKLKRVLVSRTDRIGDVVLSTPVVEALHAHDPSVQIIFLAQKQVLPLLRGLPSVHQVLAFEPEDRHWGLLGVWNLAFELAQMELDAAILVCPNWKVAMATWIARVPRRVGRLSKLTDFLFLNRTIRQRRSDVAMHEAEYNLQLVQVLTQQPLDKPFKTKIAIEDRDRENARRYLDRNSIRKPFWVVHPGMGGSALNWSARAYAAVIEGLLDRGHRVLVSSGPLDQTQAFDVETWLAPAHRQSERLHWYRAHREQGSVGFLAGLLDESTGVIAPSTGPLHIAVALGKPVITFYPPIKVQSAKRWGPFQTKSATVYSPDVTCPAKFDCLGDVCEFFPCMERLTPSKVLEQIARYDHAVPKELGSIPSPTT